VTIINTPAVAVRNLILLAAHHLLPSFALWEYICRTCANLERTCGVSKSEPITAKVIVSKQRRAIRDINNGSPSPYPSSEGLEIERDRICDNETSKDTQLCKMSTYNLTIHDLLRITYTYEAQAFEAQARTQTRPRRDSACSVSVPSFKHPLEKVLSANMPQMPETCSHPSPPTPSSPQHEMLETDFTQLYCQKGRRT
jgi:hypothetical protein